MKGIPSVAQSQEDGPKKGKRSAGMPEGAKAARQGRQPQTRARPQERKAQEGKKAAAPASPVAQLLDLQRAAGNAAVAEWIGAGQPLNPDTRSFMEDRFGHDFGSVRVHAGTRASQSARSLRARAYTVGHDVVSIRACTIPAPPPGGASWRMSWPTWCSNRAEAPHPIRGTPAARSSAMRIAPQTQFPSPAGPCR